MHKNATKYNETLSKWCKNKHGASKIMDTLETYQPPCHGHHLLAAGDATYRATHLPPSHVTQLDGDEDSNLEHTRL
jgi:hypothetical protein